MKLKIDLEARADKKEQIYFLGKIKAPISINCRKGVALLIFTSVEEEEEIQIGSLDKELNNFPPVNLKDGKFKIPLHIREDQDGATFYVGKIPPMPITLDCSEGASFMVFSSHPGYEELQIVSKVVYLTAPHIEVIKR